MLYTYENVIHGYSTRLTVEEAELLRKEHGILFVIPAVRYELHTTRTPEFLGLTQHSALFPTSASMSDVIVGVLDTGFWPELKSFDDSELGPVASWWKGGCQVGKNFSSSSCNRKLIGASNYGYRLGCAYANFLGYANGTSRGMASHARVAIYKACWHGGCFSSDISAAMDRAIADGVNILSMSIGGRPSEYYLDVVAIGAFSAVVHGVFVSCSAGNGGPVPGSLSNVEPRIATIGAGTLDREFPTLITLGNGEKHTRVTLFNGKLVANSTVSLVYGASVSNTSVGGYCLNGILIPEKVSGKIVVCD
ncbi:Subtilisin-like protease SBT1.7 [Hibiscus syriacus]|uniref:Subtilisin-like protease SBT1.7 n=1 Tax=Hibiscus syriacus TaxID=106335 RepID=A0A6A2YV70_HIBSY|nr:Subtilisin-like protease SBT1.7 [Hibiscus syriacus]